MKIKYLISLILLLTILLAVNVNAREPISSSCVSKGTYNTEVACLNLYKTVPIPSYDTEDKAKDKMGDRWSGSRCTYPAMKDYRNTNDGDCSCQYNGVYDIFFEWKTGAGTDQEYGCCDKNFWLDRFEEKKGANKESITGKGICCGGQIEEYGWIEEHGDSLEKYDKKQVCCGNTKYKFLYSGDPLKVYQIVCDPDTIDPISSFKCIPDGANGNCPSLCKCSTLVENSSLNGDPDCCFSIFDLFTIIYDIREGLCRLGDKSDTQCEAERETAESTTMSDFRSALSLDGLMGNIFKQSKGAKDLKNAAHWMNVGTWLRGGVCKAVFTDGSFWEGAEEAKPINFPDPYGNGGGVLTYYATATNVEDGKVSLYDIGVTMGSFNFSNDVQIMFNGIPIKSIPIYAGDILNYQVYVTGEGYNAEEVGGIYDLCLIFVTPIEVPDLGTNTRFCRRATTDPHSYIFDSDETNKYPSGEGEHCDVTPDCMHSSIACISDVCKYKKNLGMNEPCLQEDQCKDDLTCAYNSYGDGEGKCKCERDSACASGLVCNPFKNECKPRYQLVSLGRPFWPGLEGERCTRDDDCDTGLKCSGTCEKI